MIVNEKLRLITMEIVPLRINESYDPLPSHLTLVSRFQTSLEEARLINLLKPIANSVRKSLELRCENTAIIGPKQTPVLIVTMSSMMRDIHDQIIAVLKDRVTFKYPQFLEDGWRPHISRRDDEQIDTTTNIDCTAMYLIEVNRTEHGDKRYDRARLLFTRVDYWLIHF